MRISHKHKFVFLSKWKCGSETVREILNPYTDIFSTQKYPYYHHTTALPLKNHFDSMGWDWDDYFVFVSVRNPWEMLVSLYFYGLPDKNGKYYWERHWEDIKKDIYLPHHRIIPENIISFNDWINNYDLNRFTLKYFAFDKKGQRIVNYIMKLENIEEEIIKIGHQLGINFDDVKIPRLNMTAHPDYQVFYSEKTIQLVADIFRSDIQFGRYEYKHKKIKNKTIRTNILDNPLFQYERDFLLNQLIRQKSKIDKIKKENEYLINEQKTLSKEIKLLSVEKKDLYEKVKYTKTHNDVLERECDRLTKHNNELIATNMAMISKTEKLSRELHAINEKNNSMTAEKQALLNEIDKFEREIFDLTSKCDRLEKKNIFLLEQQFDLCTTNNELEENIRLIKIEKIKLSSELDQFKDKHLQILSELKDAKLQTEKHAANTKYYADFIEKMNLKCTDLQSTVTEYSKTIDLLIAKLRENKIGVLKSIFLNALLALQHRTTSVVDFRSLIKKIAHILKKKHNSENKSGIAAPSEKNEETSATVNSKNLKGKIYSDPEILETKLVSPDEKIEHLQKSLILIEKLRRYEEKFFAAKVNLHSNWRHIRIKLEKNIPLKIVFVNDMGFLYGAGVALRRQVESFLEGGHNVSCIAWLPENLEYSYFDNNSQFERNWHGMRLLPETTELAGKSKKSVINTLNNAIMANNPDLIIAGNFHGVGWGGKPWPVETLITAHQKEVPVVVYAHDCYWATGACAYPGNCEHYKIGCSGEVCRKDQNEYPACPKNEIANNWKLRSSAFTGSRPIPIATNSNWTKNFFLTRFAHKAIIKTVHLGLNVETFKPLDKAEARIALKLPKEGFYIALGAINIEEERKGGKDINLLLHHFSRDNNVKWITFGDNSCKKNVHGFGRVQEDKVNLIFNAADVFINLAKEEAFGQTLLEASACSCPIVSYNSGGIPDIAKNNQNALCTETGNLKGIINHINSLRYDIDLRKRIATQGREFAVKEFSLKAQYKNWIKYLKEISNLHSKSII